MRLIKKKRKKKEMFYFSLHFVWTVLELCKAKINPNFKQQQQNKIPILFEIGTVFYCFQSGTDFMRLFHLPMHPTEIYRFFWLSISSRVSSLLTIQVCVTFFQLWDSYKWCDSYLNQPEFINRIISTRLIRVRTGLFTKCTRTISDMKTRPSSNKISP